VARSTPGLSAEQKAAALVAAQPWLELDWSINGPYGAAPTCNPPRPCVICKKPASLLSPRKKVPTHKVCAEHYYLVKTLCDVLAALGQPAVTRDELR
jgi:hypothetical protein